MTLAVTVPEELSARVPAEQRGPGLDRDAVRLLVSRGREVSHHAFGELPRLLRAGDLLVVNTSETLAAAVDGRIGHARVVVHFSTRGDDGRWAVELRDPDERGTTRARAGGPAGSEVLLPGGLWLVLEEPLSAGSERLWWARVGGAQGAGGVGLRESRGTGSQAAGSAGPQEAGGAHAQGAGAPGTQNSRIAGPQGAGGAGPQGPRVTGPQDPTGIDPEGAVVLGLMREHGRPIRYSYTERDQPLSVYQTVFALPSADGTGSAEMPSAARPFTVRMVTELVSRGVQFAPITLHTGVASAEAHEPPYPERFAVPEASARLINAAKAGGGRVVAVGTTAVRAVESAADADGVVRARAGWTDLVVTPERGVRVVDGLLTGLHEPEASHLLMLEAVAGRAAVDRSYEAALRGLYLWHEFGDVHLILPSEDPHSEDCSSNSR
ncbi:S-adenosylmethionine:tRNA ribosyltransferase-isomerase [Streptomyces sp. AS02]|uniref:S-adenosylmethionine:tRNA ribosyltransferase-isomerase n=1 Tax=Streptomyces sp. AS02 TaxID=2938946 RepID=UPI00201FE0D5|nr:S-adenosylmethionine:tRNA ribosyltransferase-isomerase [Streptomyces sp. AS02]MCL8016044.1 S-adenosylmethionine:tRNA ribosyltransferase-isomerase [Streptomyces sp. AS02]